MNYTMCLSISAPNLVSLHVRAPFTPRFSFLSPIGLKQVRLDVSNFSFEENHELELLQKLSQVEDLKLFGHAAFQAVSISIYNNELPRFQNLVNLDLTLVYCRGWELLPHLLKGLIRLRRLILRRNLIRKIKLFPRRNSSRFSFNTRTMNLCCILRWSSYTHLTQRIVNSSC